jgi:phospholipid/cholesterol/gamma-HCH transport system permease protein
MSSATTRGVDRIAKAGTGAFEQTGNIVQLFVDVARQTFVRPFQWREFIQQAWFIASVTILPTALIAIPFGAIVSLQTGSLIKQLGAESYTGAASVLVVIQQGSPLVTSLLIAGAAGSAVAADLGSRTIREEIDAMEVLGINPIQRLVVPRVLAMVLVAMLLNGLVAVIGIGGGYFFSALAQLPDLYVSTLKAAIFGVLAGVVAAYKGLHPKGGPKGVGDAVNQSVVITFLLLFLANLIITAVYLQIVPPKGS